MPSMTTDRKHFASRRHNYDDFIIIIVIDDIQRYSLICTSSQCFGREGGGGGRERKEKKDVASSSSAAFSLSVVHNQNTWFSRQTKYIWSIYTYIFTVHVRRLTTQANSYCMFAWSRCLYCKTGS